MEKLEQRYLLSSKKFTLHRQGIRIKEKSVFDDKEWEADYHDIGLDLTKVRSREGLGNAVLFGGLLIVSSHMTFQSFLDGTDMKLSMLFLFFCFMWLTVFWWSIQKYFAAHFILSGGRKTLTFFISSPDEETVRSFIETIRTKVRARLKEELSTFDPDMKFEHQLENLKYLRQRGVIDQAELEVLRENLREQHLIK